jgi:hypothetical protein
VRLAFVLQTCLVSAAAMLTGSLVGAQPVKAVLPADLTPEVKARIDRLA